MAKTDIYLVRHGQSEGNLNNVFLGHTDLDLTPLGYEQAAMTAKFLDSVSVDVIYSSDLKRAYHTAEATAQRKNLPIQFDPALREIFAGKWEGVPFPRLQEDFRESFGVWLHHFGECRCDGGESIQELQERVVSAVKRIAEENSGKTVLLFSHATPIRLLKAFFDGLELKEIDQVPWPSNASVTHATFENGAFLLLEYSVDHFMGDKITRLRKENV